MNIAKTWIAMTAIVTITGCGALPQKAAVAPNFSFTPPQSAPATRSNMAIGILQPTSTDQKGFFKTSAVIFSSSQLVIDEMLTAIEADTERIIIAKGFTTAGAYPSLDEMTFGQKQRASLILRPTFTVTLTLNAVPFGASTATIAGYAVLEFLEPLSREKVWIKRLEIAPITQPIQLQAVVGSGGQIVSVISTNSMTELLNAFYQPTMAKMWTQLDTQEIVALKRDADKLKSTTQYKGG